MKKHQRSLFLLLIAFLVCLLPLSSCREAPEPKTEGATEAYVMPYKVKSGIPGYIRLTLGDLVEKYPTIAYGTIVEKSEFAEAVKPLKDENAQTFEMGQKVTMQVEKGIQGCKDGDTITYWEIGGLSQDGTYYQPEGFDKSQPGESVLVFRNQVGSTFPIQLQVDGSGNVTVPGILLIEEASGGDTSHLDIPPNKTMPLEEYLEKIETLVEKYAQ